MTIKEVFEQAEQEVRQKGLYDAVSEKVDEINEKAVWMGNERISKIQALTSEILHLVAANERISNKKG